MTGLGSLYWRTMRAATAKQFAHRAATYLVLVGMIAEPIVYLVVWQTVAAARGGAVGGYTGGAFAAYYIVWTLVRNMTTGISPYVFEWRIRSGEMSGALLRPVHPIHHDLADYAGLKLPMILMWLPIAAALTMLFQPTFHPTWPGVVTFVIALGGAYLVRSLFLWLIGLLAFWTTRGSAIFELFLTAELLLSGRMVPMSLLPDWARQLADLLPFRWTFGFPIDTVVADLSTAQLLQGLAMQGLWAAIGTALVTLVWKRAVRRYTAVGD